MGKKTKQLGTGDLFRHAEYRSYLLEKAEERGVRADWADAVGCQRGYLSSVLNGDADFSLEQADRLAAHLGFTEPERHYFLVLVQKSRAGTPSLRDHFQKEAKRLREERDRIAGRYEATRDVSQEHQAEFYSAWYYTAVHLCVQLGIQEREVIAQRLALPLARVTQVFDFFLRSGFAEIDAGKWKALHPITFLPGDSPLIVKHHTNWRLKGIQAAEAPTADDLHYSAVFTVNKADLRELRELWLNTVDVFKRQVTEAKDETELVALTLDLFPVFKN